MKLSARAGAAFLSTMMLSSVAPVFSQSQSSSMSSSQSSTMGSSHSSSMGSSMTGVGTANGSRHVLRGSARTTDMSASGGLSSASPGPSGKGKPTPTFAVRKSSNQHGNALLFGRGSGYERTSMIPADFLEQTGMLNPGETGQYTPEYQSEMRLQMNGKQILGPMSVLHTGAGYMDPAILTSQEVVVEGIPQRVSGSLVLEAPGWDDKMALSNRRQQQNREIAARRAAHNRQMAALQSAPVRSVAARTAPNWY